MSDVILEVRDVSKRIKALAENMMKAFEENQNQENALELLARPKRYMEKIGKLLQQNGFGN